MFWGEGCLLEVVGVVIHGFYTPIPGIASRLVLALALLELATSFHEI